MATQFFLQRHSRKLSVDSLVHNLLLNIGGHCFTFKKIGKEQKIVLSVVQNVSAGVVVDYADMTMTNDYAHLDSNILLLSQAKNKVHTNNNFIIRQLGVSSGLSLNQSTK